MMIMMNIDKTYNFIEVTLLVFHFEISGKDNNDEHLENISPIVSYITTLKISNE